MRVGQTLRVEENVFDCHVLLSYINVGSLPWNANIKRKKNNWLRWWSKIKDRFLLLTYWVYCPSFFYIQANQSFSLITYPQKCTYLLLFVESFACLKVDYKRLVVKHFKRWMDLTWFSLSPYLMLGSRFFVRLDSLWNSSRVVARTSLPIALYIYIHREKEERVWFDSSACAGSSLACRRRREYISLEELFFFLFKRAWESMSIFQRSESKAMTRTYRSIQSFGEGSFPHLYIFSYWNSNQKTEAWVAQKMEVDRFVKWRTPRWSLSSRWIDIHIQSRCLESIDEVRSAVSHWGPQCSVFS